MPSFAGCANTRTSSDQRRFFVQREDGRSHRTKRVRPRSIRTRRTQLQQLAAARRWNARCSNYLVLFAGIERVVE